MKMCRVNRQLNRQRLPSNSGVELGAAARVVVEKSSMAAGATSVSGDDASYWPVGIVSDLQHSVS